MIKVINIELENEVKIVVKPHNPIELKAKKQATIDTKQAKTHKDGGIKQENTRATRSRDLEKADNISSNPYAKVYNTKVGK